MWQLLNQYISLQHSPWSGCPAFSDFRAHILTSFPPRGSSQAPWICQAQGVCASLVFFSYLEPLPQNMHIITSLDFCLNVIIFKREIFPILFKIIPPPSLHYHPPPLHYPSSEHLPGTSTFHIFWGGQHLMACKILVPWPQIEPAPLTLKARSLNHWITREVPPPIS